MPENIKNTHHNKIGTLTDTSSALAENIQQGKIDPLHRVFIENPISEIKTSNNKDEISPALKKTINILKDLIIEIDLLNRNTTREMWATKKSIDNSSNSKYEVANVNKFSRLNETVEGAYPEININSQIKEIKSMIDQFSSSYLAKRDIVRAL